MRLHEDASGGTDALDAAADDVVHCLGCGAEDGLLAAERSCKGKCHIVQSQSLILGVIM